MPVSAILFDLDGTLSDPSNGITRCIAHALEILGHPVPAPDELARFIGPPLRSTFASLLATDDRSLIEEAMRLYRERYAASGMFENLVYPGVMEMLTNASAGEARLFVATSKMTFYAEGILEHFGLGHFFTRIYGADPEGRLDDKRVLVRHIVANESLNTATTFMIGDRMHDIIAAREHGIRSVGVTYGFGSRDELLDAGADAIAESPGEIVGILEAL